ncbi:hypothetical protein [Streptomyces sp. GESEQ-35]|uniref:hypothetical protein n=1 Tax=Streptomyces sp. GESEQ-35 TaxID=2812657 RepID=UPI0035AB8877
MAFAAGLVYATLTLVSSGLEAAAILSYWMLALGISTYRSATRRAPAGSPVLQH